MFSKYLIIFFVGLNGNRLANASLSATTASSVSTEKLDVAHLFHKWIQEHNKEYKTQQEYTKSFQVWAKNHEHIERHNNQNPPPSYTLGHNQFSDLTVEEYHQRNFLHKYNPGIVSLSKTKEISPSLLRGTTSSVSMTERRRLTVTMEEDDGDDLPESVDWVKAGAVTDVKNQGLCGACWAFSAVAAVEGARIVESKKLGIANVTLVSLSEQQLLDCDHTDHSCFGGLMDDAFKFEETTDGFCSEEDWPYAMHKHYLNGCQYYKEKCTVVPNTKVTSFTDIHNTTLSLMKAISIQPVSVGIEAAGVDFQLYSGGVINTACGTQLDHGVTAVGYGEENGQKYWLVKNSWGSSWGEKGYFKLSFNSSNADDEGQCGILMMASVPTLDVKNSTA